MKQILKTSIMLANSTSLSLVIFHYKLRSLKNYSSPVLGSQSMVEGDLAKKQNFVSSLLLLFFCLSSPALAFSPQQRESRTTGLRMKAWSRWSFCWSAVQEFSKRSELVTSLSCDSSFLILPYSSTEINQKKHLISPSFFPWMTGHSQCNTNELGLSVRRLKLPGGHGQQYELMALV